MKNLQKKAGRAISGEYARVAGETYNTELDLMPIDLQLEVTIIRTVLRIMIQPVFKNADLLHLKTSLAKWTAKIEARSGKPIDSLELRKPFIYAPWEALPIATIAKDE